MSEHTDIRRRVRDRPRARHPRRALGADDGARAGARPEALHRPPHGPPPREPEHPLHAPARPRGSTGSCASASCRRPPPRRSTSSPTAAASSRRCSTRSAPGASRLPLPGPDATMSFDAHILSFRTLFDPALADGFDARVELRLGERTLPRRRSRAARFEIVEGTLEAPDAVITSDAGTVLAVAHGRAVAGRGRGRRRRWRSPATARRERCAFRRAFFPLAASRPRRSTVGRRWPNPPSESIKRRPPSCAERLAAERQGRPVPGLPRREAASSGSSACDRAARRPRSAAARSATSASSWDQEVSRLHAELAQVGDQWVLVDDGLSSNGTFVGDERITSRRRLADGDVFRVGATSIAFRHPLARGSGTTRAQQPATAVTVTPAQRRVLTALCRPYKGGGELRHPGHQPPDRRGALSCPWRRSSRTCAR